MKSQGMNTRTMRPHGGQKCKNGLDFSVNIHPKPLSLRARQTLIETIDKIHEYPEIIGESGIKIISDFYGLPKEKILLGNGAIELIYLYARALKPEKVMIVSPTFNEYERAFQLVQSQVYHYVLEPKDEFELKIKGFLDEIRTIKPDVVVLCNPNNPTGQLISTEGIEMIAKYLQTWEGQMMVDESFVELSFGESCRHLALDNVFCVQSLTKYYGIPGLRLGVGFGREILIQTLYGQKEPWSINLMALALVESLFQETREKDTLHWLKEENKFLLETFDLLEDIKVYPTETNFMLLQMKNVTDLIKYLEKGEPPIFVRSCGDFIGLNEEYIRIAIRTRSENIELVKKIRSYGGSQ